MCSSDPAFRHDDMLLHHYRAVQDLLRDPAVVWSDRARHLVLTSSGDQPLRAVIKATQDGQEIFLQSLRRSNPDDMRRKLRGKKILMGRDEWTHR